MEIIGCGKGHFYNPEQYDSCPQCAKEVGMAGSIGKTQPLDSNGFYGGQTVGETRPIGKTEPVDGSQGGVVDGATQPLDGWSYNAETTGFYNGGNQGSGFADGYEKTTFVGSGSDKGQKTAGGSQKPLLPVVGWLVCVDGPSKGRDYRIHSQYNYIGRARHMDICIAGDEYVSADKAAILAYDNQEKFFSFGPGMGHNIVRVNGKMVMNAVVLNAFDELTIGKTKLLFIPLCGERFDWDDR